ncbi:hypothetical protein [Streptomyces sp. NPDC059010]
MLDIKAARAYSIIDALADAGFPYRADNGCQGALGTVRVLNGGR